MKSFHDDITKLGSYILEPLATPLCLKAAKLLRAGEWEAYLDLCEESKVEADNPEGFWRDAMALNVLKKYAGFPVDSQKLLVKALESFTSCEEQCRATNRRLHKFLSPFPLLSYDSKAAVRDERVWCFVQTCKKFVRSVLGRAPTWLNPRFGKGATFGDQGKYITIIDKMSNVPLLTPNASWVEELWRNTYWCRALMSDNPTRSGPRTVMGNRYSSVPKTARKRRNIAVEPSLNIAYQLALGRAIRRKLFNAGIDLKNGQEIHRRLACDGSRCDTWATLDLSNASDTVAYNLVKALVPSDWFELLDGLRSPSTLMPDGAYCKLEKFSSMGNGFTFELETLMFLAILYACGVHTGKCVVPGETLFVYGDDIIVPKDLSEVAISALQYFGFTLNKDKSFVSGPFRESCGGDYFKGVNVRPLHLEEAPSQPWDWISIANQIWNVAVNHNFGGDFDYAESLDRPSDVLGPLLKAWNFCISKMPNSKRIGNFRALRGPRRLGDCVISSTRADYLKVSRDFLELPGDQIRCVKAVRLTPKRGDVVPLDHHGPETALAALLYGVSSSGAPVRDPVMSYTFHWVPAS